MAFFDLPPLRGEIEEQTRPGLFGRVWQLWFNAITTKVNNFIPTARATPDIVWADVHIPGSAVKAAGVNDPDFDLLVATDADIDYGYFPQDYMPGNGTKYWATDYWPDLQSVSGTGLYAWLFAGSGPKDEELFFNVAIPHSFRAGTELRPHIHWAKTTATAGDVVWCLEYAWANRGNVYPGGKISSITADGTGLQAAQHQVASFTNISGVEKAEGSVFMGRLFREQTNAEDTYSDDAALLEFGLHYQFEKIGTPEEFPT